MSELSPLSGGMTPEQLHAAYIAEAERCARSIDAVRLGWSHDFSASYVDAFQRQRATALALADAVSRSCQGELL